MRMRLGAGGPGKDGRSPAVMMVGTLVLAGSVGLGGLWFIFMRDDARASPTPTGDGAKLVAKGQARSDEMRVAGGKLQQRPLEEGYEFDSDGRLLGSVA